MVNKKWANNIKKITTTKGTDPLKMGITPFRDWKRVVTYSFGGLIISLGFNIYMSFQINHERFFSVEKAIESGVAFNSEALSQVLNDIAKKEENFQRIKVEGVSVADPSVSVYSSRTTNTSVASSTATSTASSTATTTHQGLIPE